MDDFLNRIKYGCKIAIFSTSIIAKYFFEIISKERPDIEVICFIDSNKTGYFQGVKILSAQDAVKNKHAHQ